MYITTTQAADLAKVTRQAIHKALDRGEIPRIDIAGRLFVDSQDIVQWMHRARARKSGRIPNPERIS